MADPSKRGKSILDAYSDSTGDTDAAAATPPSRGASILDAYQTQNANTPPPAKSWQDEYFPAPDAGDIVPPTDNPLSRIAGAGAEGFRTGPRIIDQPAIEQAERAGPVGYYINSPLMQGVNFPLRALNAAYKGGQAAIDVGLSPLNPLLGTNFSRDMAAMPEAFPFGASFLRPPGRPPIPEVPPTPRFVQEFYGEGTPNNPLAAGPAAERPAFVPPGFNIPPRPVEPPAFVPPGERPTATGETAQAAPSAGTGAAQPADNALVTPTAEPSVHITPIVTQAQAEAEADRILRHFAGDQTPVINSTPLASGAQPTLSQAVEGGHGGLAGLERGVRDVPEQNQHFVARETANTTLRNKAVGDVIGDSRDTDVTEAELNKRTAPQEAAIFDPAKTSPVDPSDAIAMLDQIRSSGKGQRDAVANALDHLRGKLIDKDGNMQTDPAQLRGVDLAIKDMISPMAAGTKQDGRAAAHELMAVRDVLRDNIEQGAPGYKDFLAQQAAERSAIDGQRFLQARNITDRQGNVNLGTLDSTIKAAERQQAMPGARLADGVTDEQLARLKELRADYQNDAKQRLGTSLGSSTVQKLGVSGSMGVMGHPLLAGGAGIAGAWAAGVSNPLLGAMLAGGGYLMKQQSLKGQRMVMDALRDKLLNPEKARSAFTRP